MRSPADARTRSAGPPAGGRRDALAVATRHYCWKPSHAFYHALELEAYAEGVPVLAPPVLDLGCGDGTFAAMLGERGLVERPRASLDSSVGRLRRAAAGPAARPVLADARALPLRGAAFGSVFANSLLNALARGAEACLAEVHRVLAPGGVFVFTVPTSSAGAAGLLPRALSRLGARGAAEAARRRRRRRLDEVDVRDEASWLGAAREAGFRVERVTRYFTPGQAARTELLALPVSRALAPLRFLRGSAAELAARLEERVLRGLYPVPPGACRGNEGTSILVVARKDAGG